VRTCARPGSDEDVHAEISSVENHLLDIRLQPMNLVDEEDLVH
jgi:hypothetical protein